MKEINLYDAASLMRKLSKENFPFSIAFISCDRTREKSDGLIVVPEVKLSAGLPSKKSKHANNLIAYEDLQTGKKKHFWLPLLMKINDLKITHDRIR